jgi:hypothetical protein
LVESSLLYLLPVKCLQFFFGETAMLQRCSLWNIWTPLFCASPQHESVCLSMCMYVLYPCHGHGNWWFQPLDWNYPTIQRSPGPLGPSSWLKWEPKMCGFGSGSMTCCGSKATRKAGATHR